MEIFSSMRLTHLFSDPVCRNMGAYSYCLPRIMTATRVINGDEKRARYVGRTVSAAPATGMGSVHKLEYQEIMEGVYGPAGPKFEGD